MLILTRNVNSSITIGDDIRVTVLSVKGSQVRIGVDAPRDIQVDREEIRANKDAGLPPPIRKTPNADSGCNTLKLAR